MVERLQRAAFALLVESYPALWSQEELMLELAADPEGFADRDAVTLAIQHLARSGLIRRVATSVVATRSAVEADRLGD